MVSRPHLGADGQDLHHLRQRVGQRPDDDQPVQQVHRDAVRGGHVGALDGADAAVGGEDDDGGQRALQRPASA